MKLKTRRRLSLGMFSVLNATPSISLISIINLLGVAQALFFSFLLLGLRKRSGQSHIFLALFLIGYGLVQFSDVLEESGYLFVFPHISSVFPPLVFALGPLIFFYVGALTREHFKTSSKNFFHFIPMVLLYLLLLPYYLSNQQQKVEMLQHDKSHPGDDLIIPYLAVAHVFIYIFLSIRLLLKYSQNLGHFFSYTEKINLKWLTRLVGGLSLIWIVWLLNTRFAYTSPLLKYSEAALFTGFIYALGFKGLTQREIFEKTLASTNQIEAKVVEEGPVLKKYEKSSVPQEKLEWAAQELKKKMEEEKLYRNNELTLSDLAQTISIPNHHLSQVLNEHLKTSFYDYVNNYRVLDVKEELLNPKNNHLTILALALDSGFNSKASFNKAFKKVTGMSPSEYKKMNN